jgi:uncharacterized protein (TIGR02246 family)
VNRNLYWITAVAVVLLVAMVTAQNSPHEQQIIGVERQLFDALKNQDAKALAALLADDFQFRNAGDEVVGKPEFLKAATSVDGTILSVDSDNMRVQIHGDIAVLSGTQRAVVKLKDGKQVTGLGVFTDVFVHCNRRWLLVFAHNIDLPDTSAPPQP